MAGSQDFAADPRNAGLQFWVDGALVAPEDAKVSIFDAGFGMGDGVWEGLRLHKGAVLFLDRHLDRLVDGAARLRFPRLDREAIRAAIRQTIDANSMHDGAHLRLMVTRGRKSSINQDPRNVVGAPTVVITAEYKRPPERPPGWGLTLKTVSIRCTGPEMFDMRLNTHSRLNLIMALNEAIEAGADEALMLDPHAKVSSCNATNFFFVRGGSVHTSTGVFCFDGITRAQVIELCRANAIPVRLDGFEPELAREADEAFVTGTMGGITPVRSIDDAALGACPGPVTERIARLYETLKDREAAGFAW
ncbi:MAG TPA: aminotransferase class IV [Caulobacteraceae bacterium]|jgi:branched-chain amino acid aminotransferase|nr:aminotransferase class IV [Caulobacteraceae bacterium]